MDGVCFIGSDCVSERAEITRNFVCLHVCERETQTRAVYLCVCVIQGKDSVVSTNLLIS